MNGHNFDDEIIIDDTPSEALDQVVKLRLTWTAAQRLELAAFCKGMTQGELVAHMLDDLVDC